MNFSAIFNALKGSDALKAFGKGMSSAPAGSSPLERLFAGGTGLAAQNFLGGKKDDEMGAEGGGLNSVVGGIAEGLTPPRKKEKQIVFFPPPQQQQRQGMWDDYWF